MSSASTHNASEAPWDDSSGTTTDPPADPPQAAGRGTGGFWAGRSGLAVPLVLIGVSTYLVYGMVTMPVSEDTDFPGPRFYPMILAITGYLLALLLVLEIVRRPEHPEDDDGAYRFYSDWKAVAWLIGGFLVFAIGIEFLGWILAGALLFWCVARGVGSKRPIFDLSLALVFSSLIYLGFAKGLGLSLPSGLLGGL